MEDDTFRSSVLRLASEKPELRKHLLPILRRTAMTSARVRDFLQILRGLVTRFDQKLQVRQPNLYRLGHLLEAVAKVEKMAARHLNDDSPEAMEALKGALRRNFTVVGDRFDLPPVNALVKQIDAWVATGKLPKYI